MNQTITLTKQELFTASCVGLRRMIASLAKRDRRGLDRKSDAEKWFVHIVGAQGELAFAQMSGCYWPMSVNAPKDAPDVFPDWQVRCRAEDNYDLIVRPDDPDHFKYALITGKAPTFTFRGWMKGGEAKALSRKNPDWIKDRGGRNEPVIWVPQSALIKELPASTPVAYGKN